MKSIIIIIIVVCIHYNIYTVTDEHGVFGLCYGICLTRGHEGPEALT